MSTILVGALGMLLTLPLAAPAEDGSATCEADKRDSQWKLLMVPYLWLPEAQGSVQVGRLSAPIDVDIGDMFDLLGNGYLLAGMGQLEASRGPFTFMVNAIGGTVQPTTERTLTTVDSTLNFTFIEFGPAYRLLDYPVRSIAGRFISVEALAGGRFMYLYQEIDVSGRDGRLQRSADTTLTWVDPFVGGRWSVPLAEKLDLFFRGDIGGFGAGSKLAWNLLGGFRYELPWTPASARTLLYLGYKAFDFDYQTGNNSIALTLRGPAIGFGFEF